MYKKCLMENVEEGLFFFKVHWECKNTSFMKIGSLVIGISHLVSSLKLFGTNSFRCSKMIFLKYCIVEISDSMS